MLTAANHENSETARLVTVLVLGSLLLTLLCGEKITKKKNHFSFDLYNNYNTSAANKTFNV